MTRNTMPTCEGCGKRKAVIGDSGNFWCHDCYEAGVGPGADDDIRRYQQMIKGARGGGVAIVFLPLVLDYAAVAVFVWLWMADPSWAALLAWVGVAALGVAYAAFALWRLARGARPAAEVARPAQARCTLCGDIHHVWMMAYCADCGSLICLMCASSFEGEDVLCQRCDTRTRFDLEAVAASAV